MKRTNNTVVITGGSTGIGFELAKRLVQQGDKVIVCGRSRERLMVAKKMVPSLVTYPCDLSKRNEREEFASWLKVHHPDINVLVNNAAIVNRIDFLKEENAMDFAETEYQTNLLAPIHLVHLLYGVLQANENPTIINVTTGLIYAPRVIYPFYNSSKAGLHSFTQTLRLKVKDKNIKVIEAMFPAVNTEWHQGNPPKIAIPVEEAVDEMLKGWKQGKLEIRIKGAKILYALSRIAPSFALKKINQIA